MHVQRSCAPWHCKDRGPSPRCRAGESIDAEWRKGVPPAKAPSIDRADAICSSLHGRARARTHARTHSADSLRYGGRAHTHTRSLVLSGLGRTHATRAPPRARDSPAMQAVASVYIWLRAHSGVLLRFLRRSRCIVLLLFTIDANAALVCIRFSVGTAAGTRVA